MPTPSLILVPARFKTGKLYTPVATTSGGVVLGASGDFNVTRATTATRVNASGLIEVVASGIPRLDYFGSSCPALLVEPSAQNLAFIVTGYSLLNATTGSLVTSPEGTSNAITFVESSDAVATNHQITTNSITFVSGTTYVFSAFFKAGNNNRSARLALPSARFVGSPAAIFDITSGSVLLSGDCTASIQNYGNGWFRAIITAVCDSAGTGTSFLNLASGATRDYIGNGSGSILVYGSQIETGSVATSYIPTTTAAVTRNADVISLSGAVSGCIGQTEGTIYVEMIPPSGGTGINAFLIGDGTSNNFMYLGKNGANLQSVIRSDNITRFSNTSFALTGNAIKAALGYKSGDFALYANGSIVASGTTAFTFTSGLTRIGFPAGFDFSAPTTINKYNAVALYTTRLTNQELADLTT